MENLKLESTYSQPGTAYHGSRQAGTVVLPGMVEEICAPLFSSFRRRDQREKAMQYLHGLIVTEGRKSIRNIAATIGEPKAVQSLHHFIANSTWDWRPVRAALAARFESIDPSRVWVVQPMAVPKAGECSVGVSEIPDPNFGRPFWGQQAFGVWAVSQRLSVAINWRLFLPDPSTGEGTRGGGRNVPQGVGGETLQSCAAAAALTVPSSERNKIRPVVLNFHGSGTRSTLDRFVVGSVPVLAQAKSDSSMMVADPAFPGFGRGNLSPLEILASAMRTRHPVRIPAPGEPQHWRNTAAVPVLLPSTCGGRKNRLLLWGEWASARQRPALWLTNMTGEPLPRLVEVTRLARRVGLAVSRNADTAGFRDFSGRSFEGWHRHITLASVAHAVMTLAGQASSPHGDVGARFRPTRPARC